MEQTYCYVNFYDRISFLKIDFWSVLNISLSNLWTYFIWVFFLYNFWFIGLCWLLWFLFVVYMYFFNGSFEWVFFFFRGGFDIRKFLGYVCFEGKQFFNFFIFILWICFFFLHKTLDVWWHACSTEILGGELVVLHHMVKALVFPS